MYFFFSCPGTAPPPQSCSIYLTGEPNLKLLGFCLAYSPGGWICPLVVHKNLASCLWVPACSHAYLTQLQEVSGPVL